jgi:hypothetical protein
MTRALWLRAQRAWSAESLTEMPGPTIDPRPAFAAEMATIASS